MPPQNEEERAELNRLITQMREGKRDFEHSENDEVVAAIHILKKKLWDRDGALREVDLQGADLQNIDLSNSDLTEANLSNAKLEGTNLEFATICGINLKNADLSNANLQFVDGKDAYFASAYLVRAQFNGANLKYCIFESASLHYAKLKWTDLWGANFDYAVLEEADLFGANLQSSQFWHANLSSVDLTKSNLRFAYMRHSKLWSAKLDYAKLEQAKLGEANLERASLVGADLYRAGLTGSNLSDADLTGASLKRSSLGGAKFVDTNVERADFSGATFGGTVLAELDLSTSHGLSSIYHSSPSFIDYVTLYNSWPLPEVFLKGCGVPDGLITFMPSLVESEGKLLATFISYSHRDIEFANKLHDTLQNAGSRVYRDEKHLKIGQKIFRTLSHAIREHNRLILVCSKDSLQSDWVNREVTAALEYEMELQKQDKDQYVVMPITIDDYIFSKDCDFEWAPELRARLIGDFQKWEDPAEFQKSLDLLIRSLQLM